MKVCVNEILSQGLDIEQELDPKVLALETVQVKYPSYINLHAHMEREKDIIYARISIKATESIACSRCLEWFDRTLERDADFIYKPVGGHVIDLSDDIRDTMILEHPIRALCRADCKGLCYKCGANLNQIDCGCVKK